MTLRHDDHPTPLPWHVAVLNRAVYVYGGPNRECIAEFSFSDEHPVKITKDEATANATLFAASQDLLAACREINYLRLVIESAVRNSDPKNHAIVLEALRAVRASADAAMVKP